MRPSLFLAIYSYSNSARASGQGRFEKLPCNRFFDERTPADWLDDYRHEVTLGRPPNPLVVRASERLLADADPHAILTAMDLGSGAGAETGYLIGTGRWRVTAVDRVAEGLDFVSTRIHSEFPNYASHLLVLNASFDGLVFPTEGVDLIVGLASVGYEKKGQLPALLDKIVSGIKPGGLFVGQFLGESNFLQELYHGFAHFDRAGIRSLIKKRGLILENPSLDIREVTEKKDLEGIGRASMHNFTVIGRKPPTR